MRRGATPVLFRSALAAALTLALVPAGQAPVIAVPVGASSGAVASDTWTGFVVVGVVPGGIGPAEQLISAVGGIVARRSGPGSFLVVQPPSDVAPDDFIGTLLSLEGVRWAEPEQVVRASLVPDDPGFPQQWNLERIGMIEAWDASRGSEDVRVAVVDSGVDAGHPDLEGRVDTGADYDFVDRDANADDEYGHGTHVAGVIAANTDNGRFVAGMADGCTVVPVRTLDSRGLGETSTMAEGIRYAADQEVDVINVSAGGPDDSRVLADAVDYAISKGCLIIAAAGNRGIAGLDYPAAYPDVIAVGAIERTDRRATYSQYADGLDIVAPGSDVYSLRPMDDRTRPEAGAMTGTSMATPHVAAVAALLRSMNPTWTAGHISRRILETAEDLGPAGRDVSYGYGLLRADLALGADGDAPGVPSDDEFPGIPLSTGSAVGIVDVVTDPVDVHSVGLSAGQELKAWIKGSDAATISLTLYDPTGNTMADAAPLESVITTGESVSITYPVPDGADGRYRLVVRADEGGGEYALTWRKGRPTSVSAMAPKTCAWAGTATITGVVSGLDGEPLDGVRLVLDERASGDAGWTVAVGGTATNAAGGYRLTVRPARRTDYRVRFEGAQGQLAATGPVLRITPRAALGAPQPAGKVRRGVPFTVAGTLRPQHPAGERTVRVTLWARDGGRWVVRRTVWAENRDRDGSTRYSARLSIPSAGRWRITASVAATEIHVATTSAAVLLSVP